MRVLVSLLIALFGAVPQSAAPGEADEILAQLSKIRLDKKQIRSIRDITIRRDVLSITLTRGTIGFLEPVAGKVTGAVFVGSGEVVAIPPGAIEKQQMYKFSGSPILTEPFHSALFRFTDNTYEEILRELALHADDEVPEEDAAQLISLEETIARRSSLLNSRLLVDLLDPRGRPLFLSEIDGDKTGPLNVVFDQQQVEEVAVFKIREAGNAGVVEVWGSFNQRSEARNLEAAAHEDKLPVDLLSYDIDATLSSDNQLVAITTMRFRGKVESQRVLAFDFSRALRISSVSLTPDEPTSFYQHPSADVVIVVLPRPVKAGGELALRFAYSGPANDRRSWYPSQGQQDSAAFNMSFHVPDSVTFAASANGELAGAGFSIGKEKRFADESGAKAITDYYSGILGPYPYPKLTVAEGSQTEPQNWPGLIELPPNADAMKAPLQLAQETARQWFGNKVSPATYHDLWLMEGLTGYLAAMYIGGTSSDPKRLSEILNEARESDGPIWLGQRLANPRAVSGKGMWVLHMLRNLMGEPDFRAMLRDFFDTYQGKSASTWDFRHMAEKHMRTKLDWFFDEWVFGSGIPEYAMDYKIEATGAGFVIEGAIRQVDAPAGFSMPVPLYADDQFLGRVTASEGEGEFRFTLPKKPEQILLDPYSAVLRKRAAQ